VVVAINRHRQSGFVRDTFTIFVSPSRTGCSSRQNKDVSPQEMSMETARSRRNRAILALALMRRLMTGERRVAR
jgi:hypothetical protein